jgi:hypothetical protein
MPVRALKYIFVVAVLAFSINAFGQNGRMRPQFHQPMMERRNPTFQNQRPAGKIQVMKENFISKQLALSPEQTVRFLNTYHQYQQEERAVRILKRINNSDAQANGADQVNKDLAYERQLVDIRQHYTGEFLKIMPPEKVSLIFKSERYFNDEVLRSLNEKAGTLPPGK